VSDERSADDLLQQPRIDRAQRDGDESRPRWPCLKWALAIPAMDKAASTQRFWVGSNYAFQRARCARR